MDKVLQTTKLLNSFDYVFAAYTLLQIFHGYSQGFRMMLFDTVKWVVLIIGLYFANALLLPVIMTMPWFMDKSVRINAWFTQVAMEFIPQENPVTAMIYQNVVESIPFDKLVFFLVVILVVGTISRLIIIGTLWGEKPKGRALGMVFGVLKALLITYVVMSVLGSIMAVSNPEGFLKWQNESFFLSFITKRF